MANMNNLHAIRAFTDIEENMSDAIGGLQCEQQESGAPMKLSWVAKDGDNGASCECGSGPRRDSSLTLPVYIRLHSAEHGEPLEQKEVTISGCPNVDSVVAQSGVMSLLVSRRSRRTRTEPAFIFNQCRVPGCDSEETEETFASSVFSALPPPPGLRPPPGTPSHGSVLHEIGACRPCAWYWKKGGCKNGLECRHCHLCPEGEQETRRKARVTCMRLGLTTPRAATNKGNGTINAPVFFPAPFSSELPASIDIEQESTTCASSDQELTESPNSEDDSTVRLDSIHDGKVDSVAATKSRAQTRLQLNEDAAEVAGEAGRPDAETQGEPSYPAGILQRRGRRTRTEPIKLCWDSRDDVIHTYVEDKESDKDTEMHEPVQPPPGLRPVYGAPSVGSALHGAGRCRPCAWYWKPGSCQNGSDCRHCHLCPEEEIKNRKKAKQTYLRLGLTSPKAGNTHPANASITCFE